MNRPIDRRNLGHPGIGYIPAVREHVEHRTGFIDSRNALGTKIEMTAEQRMFDALDPKSAEKLLQERHKEYEAHLDQVADAYRQPVMDMRGTLLSRMKASPVNTATINRIINGLSTSARTAKAGVHPYKTSEGIDFRAVEADQKFLQTMMGVYPDIQQELTFLGNGLEELSRQDPRYGIRQFERRREEPTKTDEMFNGIGSTAMKLIGAIGVLMVGVNLWNKRFPSFTSLLFVTIGLASIPQIRNLFSDKDKLMLQEIDHTTNHPLFRELCSTYEITGSSWATFTRRTMNDHTDADKLWNKLKQNGMHVKGIERDIDAYVARSGLQPKEKANLQKMIIDGRFPDFIQALSAISSPDAQSVTHDFVKTGASVYDGQIANAKRQVNPLNGLSGIR